MLEVTVFDEDRDKKVEFLGKIAIPLLRVSILSTEFHIHPIYIWTDLALHLAVQTVKTMARLCFFLELSDHDLYCLPFCQSFVEPDKEL